MWIDLFQNHILRRGKDYFIANLVENVYIKDNIIEATVYGSEEYKVEFIKDKDEIIDLECSCPHAKSGNKCKHMAAVLFYLEDKEQTLARQDIDKSIDKLVEEADEIEVRDFLKDILKKDEKLLNIFKIKFQKGILPRDIKYYKNQINSIFGSYRGYDDFIDYKNAWDFILELEEILENDIEAMLAKDQLKEAFELTNYIFIRLGDQDMDDSDGGTGEIASICLEIWEEILDKSDMELKREIFKWFIDHLDGSVIDYMEDYIEQIIFDDFKENEFTEPKLIFIDNKIDKYKKDEDSWISSYKLGQLVLHRINIMEENKVDQNIIEEYYKDNLDINEIRKDYIDICIDRKDYDMAVKLLKEGKEKGKDWPGLVLDYSLILKDLYKEMGKDKLYEEELWRLVLDYKAGDLDLYKELKSIYGDKEWINEREKVFSKLSPYQGVDKLYELEGLYDRLINLVLNSRDLYKLMEYEEVLKDIYPEELLNKYENTVETMARNTSDRAYYRKIVSILRRIKKYPKGEEKVDKIVSNWRLIYKNRPAMMDELSKL